MSNVERRMSNVEGGNFETKKEFGIIGKECRMSNAEYRISNVECRRGNTVDLILLGRKDGTSNVEVGI